MVPKSKISEIIEAFNAYDRRLNFIFAKNNGKLSSLELQLMRNESKIFYHWPHKSTYSGRILNFNSNHPISEKRAMVYSRVEEAIVLSDQIFIKKNIAFVSKIL